MKKSVVTIVIFLFFEYNLGDDESDLFQSNDPDCWYKPSCNLSQSSNVSSIPLVAGCKCDVDCLEYNDCCKDSKYFGESRVRSGKEFNCHPKLKVQMVASCPESCRNASVARNCSSFEVPVRDVAFVVPVTNVETGTTYANEYCAGCHNETDYEPWDLTVDFVEVTPSFLEDETAESGRVDRPPAREERASSNEEEEEEEEEAAAAAARRIRVEDLFRSVRFQPAHESFVADFRGRTFVCAFDAKMPAEMAARVRRCLPDLISECPDDGRQNRLCQSYTEVVYDRLNALSFRNRDCAECNAVPPHAASYCPRSETAAADPAHALVISGRDKAANRDLCANSVLPGYFCPTESN